MYDQSRVLWMGLHSRTCHRSVQMSRRAGGLFRMLQVNFWWSLEKKPFDRFAASHKKKRVKRSENGGVPIARPSKTRAPD